MASSIDIEVANLEDQPAEVRSPFSPASTSSRQLQNKTGNNVRKPSPPPEHDLILVALRLSVLEKAASGLGLLAFVWATVVLLGGFVADIESMDFWVISALLLTEGTRVFSRSHELEWQQAAPRLSVRARAKLVFNHTRSIIFRNSSKPDLAAVPEREMPDGTFAAAHRVSALLYYMQLVSALVCVVLSATRLSTSSLGRVSSKNKNRDYATGIFYSLVLGEAFIFLVERAYWEYEIGYKGLVANVSRECTLEDDQIDNVRRFFYEVYSECLKGSIFDVLDMDLVSYAMEDIQENNGKEQLGGACILLALLGREDFVEATMRRIGSKPGVVERLIEMLTWKEKYDEEIRRAAAQVLCKIASQKSASFRIVAVAGALENIVSLLREESAGQLQLAGLRILKRIARDHQNCIKIGNAGGLLPILMTLIEIKDAAELKNKEHRALKVLKKSLQVLKRLATTTGYPGKLLRENIAKVVFTIRHLRNVLEHARNHPVLQELALDILTSLALDNTARENIGSTGGIIRNILQIFLQDPTNTTSSNLRLCVKAGEALNVLALRSPTNCQRMCKGDGQTLNKIIAKLAGNARLATCAAKILRNLYTFLSEEEATLVAASTPELVGSILVAQGKELEAALGLAAATVPHTDTSPLHKAIDTNALARKITEIISRPPPSHKLLRLRRYAVELLTALVSKGDARITEAFHRAGIHGALRSMADTISDVENFYTFSGEFGLTRHAETMESLLVLAGNAINPRDKIDNVEQEYAVTTF